jgi:hypothetical protein
MPISLAISALSGSVCKIGHSRAPADGVQYGCELIQALLAIEDLIRSLALGYQRVLSIDFVERHHPALY